MQCVRELFSKERKQIEQHLEEAGITGFEKTLRMATYEAESELQTLTNFHQRIRQVQRSSFGSDSG